MKPSRILLALAFASLSVVSFAADKVKAELEANYKAITTAFQKNDIKALGKYFAPNCTAKDVKQPSVTREKIIADFQRQMTMLKNVTWDRKITKFVHKGNTATATVDGHFRGSIAGQDGKPHVIDLMVTSVDVWTKAKTGWQIESIAVQKRTVKMDGKPMNGG